MYPSLPKFRSRGFAGTATIWSSEIDHLIEPIPDGSHRINAVLISTSADPILLLNTYMPTEGAANVDYTETLDEIHELLCKYSLYTNIWTGDINASHVREKPSSNNLAFKSFCDETHLQVSRAMPNLPTFYHCNGRSTSTIDLFIHRKSEAPIDDIKIDTQNPLNTSPHDPVTAEILVQPPQNICSVI